ncbi:MAG: FAD-dependent oxidoreductase, partial [Anaerolineae bacterium]|nr:FAD-dependent oxidoreductase [Anaerolineae bacterium]
NIAAPNVVIAAGAGARALGHTAGIELPVILRPRQSFTTGWRHDQFPEDAPMIIGAAPFPHVRPEARSGAIFGWEYTWNAKHTAPEHRSNLHDDALIDPEESLLQLKDQRFPSITLALLARQFGHKPREGFADARYLRGISHNIGYYVYRDVSAAHRLDEAGQPQPYDSERAIIDQWPTIRGLFVSIAHVGHGIMSSPAAGEILAHKILGLPLPDPVFEEFGLDTPWVEYDEGVL